MGWNGHLVVDMDAHIRERADTFFKDYIDPEYRAPFNLLCEAIALQEKKGERYALFGQTTAVIEQVEAGPRSAYATRSALPAARKWSTAGWPFRQAARTRCRRSVWR